MAIKTRFCNGFLLLVLMSITWSINAVLPCEFGPGCLHECHCAVSCDNQTGCTGQCAAGWDGPTCQRQNVALNRTTTQSSTYSSGSYDLGSHNAVDGRIGHNLFALPCTHTKEGTSATPATWSVTLDGVYRISRFQIYNRDESCGTNNPCARRLAGFTLSVGNSSSQIYRTCYTDPTADGINPGNIITKSCNQPGPLSGNMVQISAKGNKVLALCEVLIYVCSAGSYGPDCGQTCGFCAQGRKVCDTTSGHCPHRPNELRCQAGYSGETCKIENVALNRPTTQSSTFSSESLDLVSRYAVDGRLGHKVLDTPCTHTKGGTSASPDTWNVTLDRVYRISRFQIYNRVEDCGTIGSCALRLAGFTLSVGNSSSQIYRTCYIDPTADGHNPGNIITQSCNQAGLLSGDIVQISAKENQVLALCEVLIYVCAAGSYGQNCEETCGFCAQGRNICDRTSGNCPDRQNQSRCGSGYSGQKCQTACSNDKWGADCLQSCGQCHNGAACDKSSGECPAVTPRCSAGYIGQQCNTECNNGKWGSGCVENCGHCRGGMACTKSSGACPAVTPRCSAGYMGQQCNTECVDGNWGVDCQQNCSHCYNETACNKTLGECPAGNPRCSAGYNGAMCETKCDDGNWGVDCQQNCRHCYNETACNKTSGECPAGNPQCSAGYSGTMCETMCVNGTYGEDCQYRCGFCAEGSELCNGISGDCPDRQDQPICIAGYAARKCQTECKKGTWGFNCKESCSQNCLPDHMSCDKANGTCLQGCANKYSGERCAVEPMPNSARSPVSGIVGGVIGAVVCGAVIVAAIILFRRRRHPQPKANRSARDARELNTDPAASAREPQRNVEVQLDDVGIEVDEDDNIDPYQTLGESPTSVQIDELPDYVKRKKTCGGFKKEFEKFPAGLHAKHEVADKEQNKAKSRYKNLVAYDHSRVVLRTLPDDEHSDYINACHINGYKEPKKFIAAQGPNEVIIDDFVRMIWEQNAGKVVMLTNLVEGTRIKCDQYWPTAGSKRFGLIEVTLFDEEVVANYTIRTLQFTHAKVKNKVKTVQQFHFTTWPDHGAPSFATGLLDFWHKVLHQRTALSGPILVHCSAGIGRTGTFIALDYLINQAKEENSVDVAGCVRELRQQRVNMVQTQVQYEFLHEALVEGIQLSDCYVSSENFANVYNQLMTTNPETEQTKMAEQFKVLQDLTPVLGESDFTAARHPENRTKNRSNKILASNSCRPFLSTPVAGCNDYINAVFVPSFKLSRGFILTQSPLQNTVVDFWRLVYEFNVSTIVMLDSVAEHDKNVGIYWPGKREIFDPFVVEAIDVEESDDFCVSTYKLTYKDMEAQHHVQQIRCKFWPGKPSSHSLSSLLLVMQNAQTWQKTTGNGPIIVHCRDGVTKSGMYCVASSIIEKLKTYHEVNIPQTVAEMRTSLPEIIANLEQYRCLYQIINGYLDNFQTYANFS